MSSSTKRRAGLTAAAIVVVALCLAWPREPQSPAEYWEPHQSPRSVELVAESGPNAIPEQRALVSAEQQMTRIDIVVRNERSQADASTARIVLFAIFSGMQPSELSYSQEAECFTAELPPGPYLAIVTQRGEMQCHRLDLQAGHFHYGVPGIPYAAKAAGDVYINVQWASGDPAQGADVVLATPTENLHATSNAYGDAIFRNVPYDDGLTNVIHAGLGGSSAAVMLPAHDGTNPIGTFYPITLRHRPVHKLATPNSVLNRRSGAILLRRQGARTAMYSFQAPSDSLALDISTMPGPYLVDFAPISGPREALGSVTVPDEASAEPLAIYNDERQGTGELAVRMHADGGWIGVLAEDDAFQATHRPRWLLAGRTATLEMPCGNYRVFLAPKTSSVFATKAEVRCGRVTEVVGPIEPTTGDRCFAVTRLASKSVFVIGELSPHPTDTVMLCDRGAQPSLPSMLVKSGSTFTEVFCSGRGTFSWPGVTREIVIDEYLGGAELDAQWLLRGQSPDGLVAWTQSLIAGKTTSELDGRVELVCGNGAVAQRTIVSSNDDKIAIVTPPAQRVSVMPTGTHRRKCKSPFVYIYRRASDGVPSLATCEFTGIVIAATARTEVALPKGEYVLVGGTSLMDAAFYLSTGRSLATLSVADTPVECVLL